MQLPNQPIMWLQCNAQNHEDTGQDLQFMYTLNIKMGRKCDLTVTDYGMIVNDRQFGWSYLETIDLNQSLEFTQSGVKNKKH